MKIHEAYDILVSPPVLGKVTFKSNLSQYVLLP